MAAISFKSVGKTQEQKLAEALNKTQTPIGIKTPLRLGVDDIVATNTSLLEQIGDNLRNLILTNYGERVGLYDFGANLQTDLSEFVSQDDFDSSAVQKINAAVARWMPFVALEDYLSEIDRTENKNTAVIKLNITYTIPTLQSGKKMLQVVLYVL